MKVKEIHNEFMLLAQQMGMKSVRAILPEELDRLINLEVIEYVKDVFSRKGNRELDGISDNVIRLTELSSLHTSIKLEAEQGDIMFGTGYKIELNNYTTPMFYTSVYSFKGDKSYRCRLIDLDLVSETMNDYHSKSIVISPICYKTESNIEVIATFEIDKFLVNYIKYPSPISSVTDTTNELSDVAMKEVIKRAVNTYNAISNNNSYEKVSNELSKLE